jgi:hypothetical protein
MKIRIKFGKETRFSVPTRQIIRTWTQLLFGTRHTLHSLAMNERPKPTKPKLPSGITPENSSQDLSLSPGRLGKRSKGWLCIAAMALIALTVQASPDKAFPSALPTGLMAKAASSSQVNLTWNAPEIQNDFC